MKLKCKVYKWMKNNCRILWLLLSLFLLGFEGCVLSSSQKLEGDSKDYSAKISNSLVPVSVNNKVKIMTTFLPIYWFTRAVAGDLAEIEVLVPPGIEIHHYQITPENIKKLALANILVKNGLGLEKFLDGAVKSSENKGLHIIDASRGINPLNPIDPLETTGKHYDKSHHHTGGNPHVWLDPILVIQQVNNIRDGLITVDPKNKSSYQDNASAYIKQLLNLHSAFQQRLQNHPIDMSCKFITFHDAFPYLAKRYSLEQVVIVELPEEQLSPHELKKVVNTVKKYQVKALFGEFGIDNKLLNNLAKDLNITLLYLDSLELGDKNPLYYFQGMHANLENLASACK